MLNGRGGQTEAELVTALESPALISHILAANMSWLLGSSAWASALPTPLVTPAVHQLPFGSCWSAAWKRNPSLTRLWVNGLHRRANITTLLSTASLGAIPRHLLSVFSLRSSLKGQYVILIIVRYELMKNWYSAPFLSTLVYKAGWAACIY